MGSSGHVRMVAKTDDKTIKFQDVQVSKVFQTFQIIWTWSLSTSMSQTTLVTRPLELATIWYASEIIIILKETICYLVAEARRVWLKEGVMFLSKHVFLYVCLQFAKKIELNPGFATLVI